MISRRDFLVTSAALAATGALGPNAFAQASVPQGYPADYGALIEGSKQESGVLIYSGVADSQMQPVLADFKALYPWVKAEHLEGFNTELTERYLNEVATGSRTADLIFVAAPDTWQDLIAKKELVDYRSPEASGFPTYADTPHPGLYPAGGDPAVIMWNNLVVPEEARPTGLEDFVRKYQKFPEVFKGKIGAYSAHLTGFGFTLHYALAKHHGDKIWDWYKVIGPDTKFERSMGTMIEKTMSGEYACCYIGANQSARVAVQDPQVKDILGLSYFHDGTPISVVGLAQMRGGKNPNSGKLMLDYLLSRRGQIAYATKGKFPGRPDITREDIGGGDTRATFEAEVGKENVLIMGYDPKLITDYNSFVSKWKQANGVA